MKGSKGQGEVRGGARVGRRSRFEPGRIRLRTLVRLVTPTLSLAVLVFVVWYVAQLSEESRLRSATPPRLEIEGESRQGLSKAELEAIERVQADMPELRMVAEQFLSAPDVEAMLATVRDREQVEPAVRDYYRGRPYAPVPYKAVGGLGDAAVSPGWAALPVLLEGGTRRPISVTQQDGRYVVDWESWVGWGEVPWELLAQTKPTEPVLMRVVVEPEQYYNGAYADESKWWSFRLTDRGGGHQFFGYAARRSAEAVELTPVKGRKRMFAVVRLRFPEKEGSDDQVEITEVVSRGWVVTK